MVIPGRLMKQIAQAAEHAYPEECCGLLVGHGGDAAGLTVTRVAASRNAAEGRERNRFEVDPKLRFDLMRTLNGGPERVVGHYHSHPDHPAQPSAHDAEMAWEPDLVWVIVSVRDGHASEVRAHVFEPAAGQFREVPIQTE